MKSASWKLQLFICFHLAVTVFLLVACQPLSNTISITPSGTEPLLSLTSTPTSLPVAAPSRIELLSQLTIGKINQMALSNGGDQLAVAAASGMYLYRALTLEPIWGSATSGGVTQVIWSTDGSRLGGVIGQNTLVTWDAHTGNLIGSLETQTDYDVYALQWLSSADRLVWLASDDVVRTWDPVEDFLVEVNTADLIGYDLAEGGPAAYTPDVSLIAISGWKYLTDGDVTTGSIRPLIMMEAATGKALYTLEDIGLYSLVTFSPDGSLLVTGSSIRDPINGEVLRTLENYPGSAESITFSPNGTMLSVHSSSNSVKDKVFIWDLTTGDLLHIFEGHKEYYQITATAWSPDGSRIATGSTDKTVAVWDVKTGELLQRITDINADVAQIEFDVDGSTLFVLSEDAHIVAWDVRTGSQLRDIQSVFNIRKLAWTTDSALLAGLSVNDGGLVNNVYIWNAKAGKLQSVITGEEFPRELQFSPERSSDQMMISSDGRMSASVEPYSGQLDVKDVATSEKIFSAPVYPYSGMSIAWSPVKTTLSVADGTARILIWNAETGEASELTANNEKFWKVDWSMNGTLLAASAESNILIWDTSTWNLFQTLEGHSGVNQLAFSPDGKMFATGSWDGVLSLWELIP